MPRQTSWKLRPFKNRREASTLCGPIRLHIMLLFQQALGVAVLPGQLAYHFLFLTLGKVINHYYFTGLTAESQFHCNLLLGLGRQGEEEEQWDGCMARDWASLYLNYCQYSPNSLHRIYFTNASVILLSKSPIPSFFNIHSKLCSNLPPALF